MRLIGLAVLFVLALLATLLLQTPLSRVQPWMPEMLRDGERFNGTLARGSVFGLHTVNGMLDLDWDLTPTSLLRGALGADVTFDWDGEVDGAGWASVGLGRVLTLREVLVTGRAQQLDKLVLPGVLQFIGDVRVELSDATLGEQQFGPVTGVVQWTQSQVIGQISVSLGDISLTLEERDGDTHGVLQNQGGDVALSGTVVLAPNGDYQTDIVAVPSPDADRGVQFTLDSIATPESGNRYRIRESGNLTQLN